jgi:diphthine synthase
MLYLIGLGLNLDGISVYGMETLKRCKRVYLENYTVDFPYSLGELENFLGKKTLPAGREFVEGLSIIDEAKKLDVALLVYGSPLTATTHITLIDEAKKSGIRFKVIYSSSILDGIAGTGLQLYKFGKISSMPTWKKSFKPDSFMEVIKKNNSIDAHSLILCDIGLDFSEAIKQLEISAKNQKIKIKDLVVCQSVGTKKQKIIYGKIDEIKSHKDIQNPFCFIIPGKLHFLEKDFLEYFR